MPPALFKLLRLQARAVVRRMFRGAKTARGATFLVVGAIMFFLWFGGTMTNAILLPRADPHVVRQYFPLAMLGFCLMTLITTAGERAVAFSPAEVDFLFPGPFSRRQLLGYKIARSAFAALFTATIFSFVFVRYAQHWLGGWIGIFLGLIFLQLLSMTIVLIGQSFGESGLSRVRKLIIVGCVIAAASILAPHGLHATPGSLPEIGHEFTNSTSGRVVLAPFRVFAMILTASSLLPTALQWAGIAIVQIAVLFAIVIRLDAHYLDIAATSGQQLYDRVQRIRRGGGVAFRATSARLRVPMLARLGGAGPIAWRQLNTALRTARAMLVILVFVCFSMGPILYLGHPDKKVANVLVGVIFWITFMLANLLRFDFRGDLDQIDMLKSLPIAPWRIAAAQLVAPVLVLIVYQLLLLLSINFVVPLGALKIAVVMLFSLPADAMLIAVENLIFLIFPVRAIAVSPGDLQGFGRQMLVFLLKGVGLLVTVALAGAVGAGAWWIGGKSAPVFLATTILVLAAEVIGMIPLLVAAFKKFDPSVDTPA
jgi:hypothetical protein